MFFNTNSWEEWEIGTRLSLILTDYERENHQKSSVHAYWHCFPVTSFTKEINGSGWFISSLGKEKNENLELVCLWFWLIVKEKSIRNCRFMTMTLFLFIFFYKRDRNLWMLYLSTSSWEKWEFGTCLPLIFYPIW